MDAAIKAEELREKALSEKSNFTFETVLSTERNLLLLKRAKEQGYFIKCIYELTADPMINVMRVKSRFAAGGHDVPQDKIISSFKNTNINRNFNQLYSHKWCKIRSTTDKYSHYKSYSQFLP